MGEGRRAMRYVIVASLLSVGGVAIAQPLGPAASGTKERGCRPGGLADDAQVSALASGVLVRIEAQPKAATVDDIQGVAAFAIDQSGADDGVVVAALSRLLNGKLTRLQQLAVQNLLRVRGCGTGALPEGGVSLGAGPGGVGGGAGATDYSTP